MITDPCITVVVGGAWTADGVTPDGNGVCWTVQKLDGWFDSTAMRVAMAEMLPLGEVVTEVRENARPLALTLVAHTADGTTPLGSALCFTAMDSVEVPFNAVHVPVAFQVIDPVLDLHTTVYRVGPIQKRILGDAVAVRFLVPLLAPDPQRFDGSLVPHD